MDEGSVPRSKVRPKRPPGLPWRAIALDGLDTELELGRVTSVDIDKKIIYLEEMRDGKWRLTYTKSLIPDISKLQALRIVREP